MNRRSRSKETQTRTRLASPECLELRLPLSSDGVLWGSDARLTLSFAPDGTRVDGHTNALFSTFDAIAPRDEWQAAVLQGFQNWARHTNSDIGLVSDDGSDFGVAGATHHDTRFGDVRVAAVPLDDALFAINISFDELIDGTWAGELLFNSQADIETVDQILAISAHEAGNIFGLADSDDPASPLFDEAIPTIAEPTPTDIVHLQAKLGARSGDIFDIEDFDVGPLGFIRFRAIEAPDGTKGGVPSVGFADISSVGEVDIFEHRVEESYSGPITFHVLTSGISQLAPSLVLKDQAGNLLDPQATKQGAAGEDISITRTPAVGGADVVLEIGSAEADANAVGGYSVVITYDDVNQDPLTSSSVDELVHYPQRMVELDDLGDYFEDGEQLFANDDGGTDDVPGGELTLETAPGFVEGTRFQIVASIEAVGDVDRYAVVSPDSLPVGAETATISLQSVEVGQFSGQVSVFDLGGTEVASNIVVHNDDQMIVQFPIIGTEQTYFIEVAADVDALGSVGTYELVARFGTTMIERETFVSGNLNAPWRSRGHSLDVNRPQLFQFGLQASSALASNDSTIEMTLRNAKGKIVLQLSTRVGDMRTASILLDVGKYSLRVRTSDRSANWAPVHYTLVGAAVDDPLGPRLNDTTEEPYEFSDNVSRLFVATFFPF